jgi:hypothetical protein
MSQAKMELLAPLVGEWSMQASFPGSPAGRAVFEWMKGRNFLVQRTQVPEPAPDGLSIIGYDEARGDYVQHYFDSRGVARLYRMGFADGVWTLSRTEPDMTPLDFSQRFTGTLAGDAIEGRWETAVDHETWKLDFELTYTRIN